MGAIVPPTPVKLIVGMLSRREELLSAAAERLAREYGPIDLRSEVSGFDATDYYAAEMGTGLLRQFLAFERLISPERIVAIKRRTNELEAALAAENPDGPPRPVNLDPGYVAESKLVLASTKDYAHRIYLGEGIYAEVTLRWARGGWRSGEHTFPDYAGGAYDGFLTQARAVLRRQLGRKEQRG